MTNIANYHKLITVLGHVAIFHQHSTWWRHQMETFSALLAICAGNSSVTGEFPAQRPVTRSFGVLFDLCLNKRLSKQCWGWWFEIPPRPLWRHCNEQVMVIKKWEYSIYFILEFPEMKENCNQIPILNGQVSQHKIQINKIFYMDGF